MAHRSLHPVGPQGPGNFICILCRRPSAETKLLNCYHMFCLNCLKAHVHDTCKNGMFPCPICKVLIPLPVWGGLESFQSISKTSMHPSAQLEVKPPRPSAYPTERSSDGRRPVDILNLDNERDMEKVSYSTQDVSTFMGLQMEGRGNRVFLDKYTPRTNRAKDDYSNMDTARGQAMHRSLDPSRQFHGIPVVEARRTSTSDPLTDYNRARYYMQRYPQRDRTEDFTKVRYFEPR